MELGRERQFYLPLIMCCLHFCCRFNRKFVHVMWTSSEVIRSKVKGQGYRAV